MIKRFHNNLFGISDSLAWTGIEFALMASFIPMWWVIIPKINLEYGYHAALSTTLFVIIVHIIKLIVQLVSFFQIMDRLDLQRRI